MRGAGCYGINGADTVTYDAALLSQAVGRPVRVQLSRKDEMAWENYGNAFVIDQRAGARRRAATSACGTTRRGRPRGVAAPATTLPATSSPASSSGRARPHSFHRDPCSAADTPLNNGFNTAPSYIAGRVRDSAQGAGVIRSERVLSHRVLSPFFTGPLRAPERLQNTFAHECFMDEVAAHVKADPVEYRLKHLNHARLSAADACRGEGGELGVAAVASPESPANRARSGRGIACVCYEGDNGYVAMVADVTWTRTRAAST